MKSSTSLSGLPGWAVVAVIVLAVIELALLVIALVVLVRTPRARLTLPIWAWALIIVFVSTLGPIAFLVAGRRPAELSGEAAQPAHRAGAGSAADLLYGPKSPTDPGSRP